MTESLRLKPVAGVLVVVLACVSIGCRSTCEKSLRPAPESLGGIIFDGFPEDPGVLSRMRDDPNSPGIVSHGWNLFKGLTSTDEGGNPRWLHWCTTRRTPTDFSLICPQGGLPGTRASKAHPFAEGDPGEDIRLTMLLTLQEPRQLADIQVHLPAPLHGIDMFTSMVFFDPYSSKQILNCFEAGTPKSLGNGITSYPLDVSKRNPDHSKCMYDAKTRSIDVFEENAVAVKAIWWTSRVSAGHIDSVRIWDSLNMPGEELAKYWPTQITPIDGPKCDNTGDYVSIGSGYLASPDYPDVPLNCFYWVGEKDSDLRNAQLLQDTIQSNASSKSYSFYNLLIGFHVATKELCDWTWQTYWWSGRAFTSDQKGGEASRRAGNPSGLPGGPDLRWSHYVMSATLGMPARLNGQGPVAENPYLEGQFIRGRSSNCLNCHQYAVFHNSMIEPKVSFDDVTLPPDSSSANHHGYGWLNPPISTHTCVGAETGSGPDKNIFENGMKTDCLWSLADSNISNVGRAPSLLSILGVGGDRLKQEVPKHRTHPAPKDLN